MSSDEVIRGWSEDEVEKAMHRAWRDAARSIHESRSYDGPPGPTARMLEQSAVEAQAYWDKLNREWLRRRVERLGKCEYCDMPAGLNDKFCEGHRRLMTYNPGEIANNE